MTTEQSATILTDDESKIISLLPQVDLDEDYLDEMEELFSSAIELDSLVVALALDRTGFFLDDWSEAHRPHHHVGPARERLQEALESTTITESSGVKKEILQIVYNLQYEYFWDGDNPDPEDLKALTELVKTYNVKDESVLEEFFEENLMEPWYEFLGIMEHPLAERISDGENDEWLAAHDELRATDWGYRNRLNVTE